MTCPPALLALLSGLGLAGCVDAPKPAQPSFYQSLAGPAASIDTAMARDMISAYRQKQSLSPLTLDPALEIIAATEAKAMAAVDKPASADAVKAKVSAAGFTAASANLSAGYHTLPEAFSGWRESAQHNRVMLDRNATHMGIATAYAPGSKYKVYWVLVLARRAGAS